MMGMIRSPIHADGATKPAQMDGRSFTSEMLLLPPPSPPPSSLRYVSAVASGLGSSSSSSRRRKGSSRSKSSGSNTSSCRSKSSGSPPQTKFLFEFTGLDCWPAGGNGSSAGGRRLNDCPNNTYRYDIYCGALHHTTFYEQCTQAAALHTPAGNSSVGLCVAANARAPFVGKPSALLRSYM